MARESIILSGLPAVGKTTVGKALAQALGVKFVGGGDALRELAAKRGYDPQGIDWWDTQQGMGFCEERRRDPSLDRLVDERLIGIAKEGDVVISSYTLPWLCDTGIKFWLKASQATRARRMASRDGIDEEQALRIVRKRDEDNASFYKELYGIELGKDLGVFDYVISTDRLDKERVVEVCLTIIRSLD